MGSLAYNQPTGSGSGGTNYWSLNGDGSISNTNSNGIEVGAGNNQLNVTSTALQLESQSGTLSDTVNVSPALFEVTCADSAAGDTDFEISVLSGYISTNDVSHNYTKISTTSSEAMLEAHLNGSPANSSLALSVTLLQAIVTDGVRYNSFIDLFTTSLLMAINDTIADVSAAIEITTTSVVLQVSPAAGGPMIAMLDNANGFEISKNSSDLFGIDPTGRIETNQSVNAVIVLPVSITRYVPIYDTTGTLLGRIPLI